MTVTLILYITSLLYESITQLDSGNVWRFKLYISDILHQPFETSRTSTIKTAYDCQYKWFPCFKFKYFVVSPKKLIHLNLFWPSDYHFTRIIISETWFNDDTFLNQLLLKGYKLFCRSRSKGKGGGMCIVSEKYETGVEMVQLKGAVFTPFLVFGWLPRPFGIGCRSDSYWCA